ncbi:MAG: O-succinylhomoserine sulfhydrylase [Rhodospirillaceae bacterium]|jgi:O-succinylhomoserine sulfhydrylase|nr:O-succinylhomoserine sulfhydrylase [Rhodospirillaceae bacterium]MBT5239012.1 O-succinylhomoserine sulfhydrylase [Rhodospirillaceae bacterium]MBT5565319.1 O-succinylhomoserine sulfhydrylase [Rhodospirillaceae bacterium]MBT6089146.1 O-succinylhomoserine sulfhydrylase [Rhodospirillaceae bacterium]MBT6960947.1 O-succinylhomoserine sulfhydrylase [Rhodospirillaceae bacterium]
MTIDYESQRNWEPQTQAVRGATVRSQFDETSEALFLNSGYVYKTAEEAEAAFNQDIDRFVYSRFGNPTVAMFEKRLALLEGAEECRAMGSGMAAVFAALASHLSAGDRLVASRALFGSCQYICEELLPRYGITTELVDGKNIEEWKTALSKPAQAVFIESPSNPGLEIIDVQAVCDLAHNAGATVFVDNVFATPVLQRPMDFGADVIIYSATKHIDGQGRCLGGAVLGTKSFIEDTVTPFIRHTGPALSPFNAWVLLKGLETLELRVDRHCDSAKTIATHLSTKNGITRLLYPELDSHPQHELAMQQMKRGGTVVAFELDGGKERTFDFLNKLEIIDISNNLGDAKSLICHPATTTHQRLSDEDKARVGLTPGFVRLSVGLEAVDDLVRDLDQALG